MRRIAIIFSTLLVFMTAMGQIKNKGNARGNSSGAPDFAYPEKVEAAALKDIDSALKRGDGPATVNAMVRLGLAKAAVSSDSLPAILAQIDALASGKDVDVVTGSVLKLLQARIYTAIYDKDAFRINRRATLAGVSAGDYRLWSKDNFLAKIKALTSEALANRQAMSTMSVMPSRSILPFMISLPTRQSGAWNRSRTIWGFSTAAWLWPRWICRYIRCAAPERCRLMCWLYTITLQRAGGMRHLLFLHAATRLRISFRGCLPHRAWNSRVGHGVSHRIPHVSMRRI